MGQIIMRRVNLARKKSGWKTKLANTNAAITKFVIENEGARTFSESNPWFEDFLIIFVANKTRPRASVRTEDGFLTTEEAVKVAGSLAIALLTNVDSTAAVDEWISNYPSLRGLDKKFKWFRPMCYSIALLLLRDSDFGLKARVIFGAGLSILDMIFDVIMIYTFFVEGEKWYANASIGMIGLNLFCQFVIVLALNKELPTSVKVQECLIVLSCLKVSVEVPRCELLLQP